MSGYHKPFSLSNIIIYNMKKERKRGTKLLLFQNLEKEIERKK